LEDFTRLWRKLKVASYYAVRENFQFDFSCTARCWCRIHDNASHHYGIEIIKYWAFAVMCRHLSVSIVQVHHIFPLMPCITLKPAQMDEIRRKVDSSLPIDGLNSTDADVAKYLSGISQEKEFAFWERVHKSLLELPRTGDMRITKTALRSAAATAMKK
jgi:hypothetical protein